MGGRVDEGDDGDICVGRKEGRLGGGGLLGFVGRSREMLLSQGRDSRL